jgi:hypothetical protein
LQQASELKKVQKKLGCKRSALGSLSEAATVFDPERLKEIISELGEEIEPLGRDPRLQDVQGLLTIVDGTLLAALPARMNCLRTSGSCRYSLPIHECCAGTARRQARRPVVLLQTPDAEDSVEGMRERR